MATGSVSAADAVARDDCSATASCAAAVFTNTLSVVGLLVVPPTVVDDDTAQECSPAASWGAVGFTMSCACGILKVIVYGPATRT